MQNGFFSFFLLLTFGLAAQDAATVESVPELKVLSWNVYMLPGMTTISSRVKASDKKKRARGIVEEVRKEGYDIIVWQETFNWRARNILKRKLKEEFPYQYGPANFRAISRASSSGITVFSAFPLIELEEIDYEACEGIDCWARKGALLLQGEFAGQPFQIMGTHLESGGHDSIRHGQIREISDKLFLPFQQDSVPVLICGDMNIHSYDSSSFQKMLQVFDVDDYDLTGEIQTTNPRAEIDYIFYRSNGVYPASISRRVRIFTHPWSEKEDWLSDHYAVELRLRW